MKSKGVNWEDMPAAYKYGTFIKREKYWIDAQDNNGNPVKAQRTRLVTYNQPLDKFTPENEKFLYSKYVNDDEEEKSVV